MTSHPRRPAPTDPSADAVYLLQPGVRSGKRTGLARRRGQAARLSASERAAMEGAWAYCCAELLQLFPENLQSHYLPACRLGRGPSLQTV
jgi:hypothetical protein